MAQNSSGIVSRAIVYFPVMSHIATAYSSNRLVHDTYVGFRWKARDEYVRLLGLCESGDVIKAPICHQCNYYDCYCYEGGVSFRLNGCRDLIYSKRS